MVRRLLGTDEGGALLRSSTDWSKGLLFSAPEAAFSVLSMSYLRMRRKEFGGSHHKGHLKRGQRDMQSKTDLQERSPPVGDGGEFAFIHSSHFCSLFLETGSHYVDQAGQNSQPSACLCLPNSEIRDLHHAKLIHSSMMSTVREQEGLF